MLNYKKKVHGSETHQLGQLKIKSKNNQQPLFKRDDQVTKIRVANSNRTKQDSLA